MEKIVILDSATGKVFIMPVPTSMLENDADEIVFSLEEELGIRETNCQYMIVNSDDILNWSGSGTH